jgi:hypothetical protein
MGGNSRVRKGTARGHRTTAAVAALACMLIAFLLVPAFASAEVFSVDTNNDEGKSAAGAVCETATAQCSLRAAVEAANFDASFDVIDLPSPPFAGPLGANSEIQLGSTLEITQPVTIVAHPVLGGPFEVPGAAVTGPAGGATFTVKANGVTIEDIAIGGGKYGIEVPGPFTGLKAKSNWFGLSLNGTPAAIQQAGIFLGPGADGAMIGEADEDSRNVFTHAKFGIEIKGASGSTIQGNYIGVGPGGTTQGSLEYGVGIYDAVGSPAEENEIGGALGPDEAGTAACDGPCNVIASSGHDAVDLGGFEFPSAGLGAASGPTTILGNYVGLPATGSGTLGGAPGTGISASLDSTETSGPGKVTIGGASPSTEGNYFDGGLFGIVAEGAAELEVIGNEFGYEFPHTLGEPAQNQSILVASEGLAEGAFVAGNLINATDQEAAVTSLGPGSVILGNRVLGGSLGIVTEGPVEGVGSQISSNQLIEQERVGIDIGNDLNQVIGNRITKAFWAGIVLEGHSNHNRIGRDGPNEANVIIESGLRHQAEDGAITMFTRRGLRNEFASNTGFGNYGAFIKLFENPVEEEVANGILPPALGTVEQSSASGTADANATVRIFSKASPEAGELGALIAVTKADAAGAWKATYAAVPVGTLVTATQTSNAETPEAGTSALATPKAAAADPAKPDEPKSTGTSTPPPAPPISTPAPKAPKVKIVAGPKKNSTGTTAKFKFKAEPAARAKFECKLDNGKWAKCSSPKTYRKLTAAKHTFRVRATASGLTGAAAKYQFTVNP